MNSLHYFFIVWWRQPENDDLHHALLGIGSCILDVTKSWRQQIPIKIEHAGNPGEWFQASSWSRNGQYVAGVIRGDDAVVRNIAVYDVRQQRVRPVAGRGEAPVWLSDSTRILFHRDGTLVLLDTRTGVARPVFSVRPFALYSRVTLSPDDRTIYYSLASNEADVWLMNVN